MPEPLTPQREQEIREWADAMASRKDIRYYGAHLNMVDLLAELDRVRVSRAAMTRSNADWLEGIGQDHAAAMLRYSLDLDASMTAAEAEMDSNPKPTE